MDPLSITAGVLSVLQTAGAVLELYYRILSAVRKAPRSVNQIIEEVRSLRDITEAIQSRLDNCDDSNDETTHQFCRVINDPLSVMACDLSELESRLQRVPIEDVLKSKWKSLKHTFVWAWEEQETKEWIDRLQRCKSTLSLAISSNNYASLKNIERATISFNTCLMETNSRLNEVAEDLKEKRKKDLIKWISPSTPWESHAATLKLHQEGTSGWLEKTAEYCDWLEGNAQVCWLSGPPGSGKTVLFAYTVREFKKQHTDNLDIPTQLFAFTYCDSIMKDEKINLRIVDTLLGSLLAQVCDQAGWFPAEILEEYEYSIRGEQVKTASSDKSQIIINSFLDLACKNQIFLFVDALDEADRAVEQLLDVFSNLINSSKNIHLFLTSRSDVPVLDIMAPSAGLVKVDLAIKMADIDRDIGVYIEGRLQSDRARAWSNSGIPEEISHEISQTLKSKSQGIFRWVQCQLDSIVRAPTIKEVRKELTTLPKGLDETYNRILLQVPPSDQDLLYKVLVWLAFSFFPLSLEQLWEAVAIDPGSRSIDEENRLRSPRDLLSLGRSLIHESDGQVCLAHASVRDHLLSTSIRQCPNLSKFALNPARAHRQLGQACLTYICFDEFRKGATKTCGEYRARIKKHPLVKHAAVACAYHFRKAALLDPPPPILSTISTSTPPDDWARIMPIRLDFFSPDHIRPQFFSWVQVLNANSDSEWDDYPAHAHPLYYASSFGLTTTVEHILQLTKDTLNSPGSAWGGTPLHAATVRNRQDVMNILLAAGADPGKGDFQNVTPLDSAASQGNMATIEILLKHNAPLAVRDKVANQTPAEWAESSGEGGVLAKAQINIKRMGEEESDRMVPGHDVRPVNPQTSIISTSTLTGTDIYDPHYQRPLPPSTPSPSKSLN